MTETETLTGDNARPDPNACTRVMVGHAIAVIDDEACVSIDVNGSSVRLSVAGARIVASQIVQWADHAEARNKARPTSTIIKAMYRVIEKVAESADKPQWHAVPQPEGIEVTGEIGNPPLESISPRTQRDKAAAAMVKRARKKKSGRKKRG